MDKINRSGLPDYVPRDPFHRAVVEGRLEEIRSALAAGENPNRTDGSGHPPLHLAANAAVAELLLQAGADINQQNLIGRTALHWAANNYRERYCPEWSGLEQAEFLLEHGIDPNVRDNFDHQNTPLMEALGNGENRMARLLIKYGADITLRNKHQQTLLHLCSDSFLLDDLIYAGLDVNAVDEDGNTPLHNCASAREARVLLSKGALIEAANNEGATPLFTCRTLEAAEFLIEHNALWLARDNDGNQPIHCARDIKRIDMLLRLGANVEERNNLGFTPLHLCRDVEVAKFLLCRGASINCMSPDRITPLHIAAVQGLSEMVKFLLDHGARPDIADRNGYTPIMLAILRYNTDHDPRNPFLALLPEIINLLQQAKAGRSSSSLTSLYPKLTTKVIHLEQGGRKKSSQA